VWFNDLDPLMHVNNGVYLSLLDLGRIDFMIKTGMYKKIKENKLYPVIASEGIKFKRSLKLFQKFEIKTKFSGFDEKYVYLEQSFWSKEKIYAKAIIKSIFLKKEGGKVSSKELKDIIGYTDSFDPKPFIKEFSNALETAYNKED
jgi:YbgC/YbaW family acyl-CoA thioester hydrolase